MDEANPWGPSPWGAEGNGDGTTAEASSSSSTSAAATAAGDKSHAPGALSLPSFSTGTSSGAGPSALPTPSTSSAEDVWGATAALPTLPASSTSPASERPRPPAHTLQSSDSGSSLQDPEAAWGGGGGGGGAGSSMSSAAPPALERRSSARPNAPSSPPATAPSIYSEEGSYAGGLPTGTGIPHSAAGRSDVSGWAPVDEYAPGPNTGAAGIGTRGSSAPTSSAYSTSSFGEPISGGGGSFGSGTAGELSPSRLPPTSTAWPGADAVPSPLPPADLDIEASPWGAPPAAAATASSAMRTEESKGKAVGADVMSADAL